MTRHMRHNLLVMETKAKKDRLIDIEDYVRHIYKGWAFTYIVGSGRNTL
jgi:hypothetical protein